MKMGKAKMKKWKKALLIVGILAVLAIAAVLIINAYVIDTTKDQIVYRVTSYGTPINQKAIDELKGKKADCILVFGAAVRPDGTPSFILRDRMDVAVELYKAGAAPKLLLSGDNGRVNYNEVAAMETYAVKAGIPKKDIFLDHAGFSTYESVYRAKAIFQVKRVISVTQSFQQYRALYGCDRMGIKAWGVDSDQQIYGGQRGWELRDFAARNKDFVKWIFKPDPTYLGDAIPISGSGIVTQN